MKDLKKIKSPDLNILADTLKSIAHPERLAILHLICKCGCGGMIVKDIYQSLGKNQSSISRHLSLMKRGGLLRREVKEGKTYYGFNTDNGTAMCMQQLLNR